MSTPPRFLIKNSFLLNNIIKKQKMPENKIVKKHKMLENRIVKIRSHLVVVNL